MAYPAYSKTWSTSFNNGVAAAATAGLTKAKMAMKIKDLMVTAGWAVVQSSNAGVITGVNYGGFQANGCGTADGLPPPNTLPRAPHQATTDPGPPITLPHFTNSIFTTDSWTIAGVALAQSAPSGGHIASASVNDVNQGASGTRHSWTVLERTNGPAPGTVQLLMDIPATTGFDVYFSPTGSFTGGTVTVRPTATDEIILQTGFLGLSASNPARKIHMWYSTDGQCLRIMTCRGGFVDGFILIDRAKNPVTGWTSPYVAMAISSAVASPTITDFASFAASGAVSFTGITDGATANHVGSVTFEAWNTNAALCTAASIGTAVNSFSSTWPVLPMGVAAYTGASSGRLGGLFDIWHAPTGVTNFDTATNATNGVVKLGGLVLPWDGSTVVSFT